MSTTPLKDALAQAAQDQVEHSFEATLAFMNDIKATLEGLGLLYSEGLACRNNTDGTPIEQAYSHGLLKLDYFSGIPTFQLLHVITDIKDVEAENQGAFASEGKSVVLLIDNNYGSHHDWMPRLTCYAGESSLTLTPGRGYGSVFTPEVHPSKLPFFYDWSRRADAVKEFVELLIKKGSPALVEALQGPTPKPPATSLIP